MTTRTVTSKPKTLALAAITGIVLTTFVGAAPISFYTRSGFGKMDPANANTWGGSDKTRTSVIFEVFIDYTATVAAATDPFTIFENGADAIGSGVAIDGANIIFAAGGTSIANTAAATGAHGLTAGQMGVQILAVLEFGGGTGTNELLSLYVNGKLVATADNPTGNDWAGVNDSNLGTSDAFNIFENVPSLNPDAGNNQVFAGAYPDQTTTITFAAYELGVGDNSVENILVSPSNTTFPLTITPAVPPATGYNLKWDSQAGRLYNVRSSPDLIGAISTWTLVEGDIPASGTGSNTKNVTPLEPRLFYAVEEYPTPPEILLSEDFDTSDGGFTAVNHTSGTIWVRGDPDSNGGAGGGSVTTGNEGSTNCWGTDIGNPGIYATGTETSLISPVIDLTSVASATLSFAQAIDIMSGDTLIVNIIDDTTDTVIEAGIHTSTPDGSLVAADWEPVDSIAIGGAALGQMVRIEWRFTGTNDGTYIGAYIDDVVVTVP